jgi:hypothetical protein
MTGPKKGRMIHGAWTTPELEYLKDNEWEFTEKVDGTNIRIGLETDETLRTRVEFAGRTDNAQIPKPLLEYLQDTFTVGLFRDADLDTVTLFGEGYGPNIQGGGKYMSYHSFVLFDVKIGPWWLSRENVDDIASKLGISAVPVLGTGTLQDAIDIVSTGITFNKGGGIVRWGGSSVPSGLKSKWGDFEAEGIVARPVVPLFDRKGERIITKIKAVDFR